MIKVIWLFTHRVIISSIVLAAAVLGTIYILGKVGADDAGLVFGGIFLWALPLGAMIYLERTLSPNISWLSSLGFSKNQVWRINYMSKFIPMLVIYFLAVYIFRSLDIPLSTPSALIDDTTHPFIFWIALFSDLETLTYGELVRAQLHMACLLGIHLYSSTLSIFRRIGSFLGLAMFCIFLLVTFASFRFAAIHYYYAGWLVLGSGIIFSIKNDLQISLKSLIPTQLAVLGLYMVIFYPFVSVNNQLISSSEELRVILSAKDFLGKTFELDDSQYSNAFESRGNSWDWEMLLRFYRKDQISHFENIERLDVNDPNFSLKDSLKNQLSVADVMGLSAALNFSTFSSGDWDLYSDALIRLQDTGGALNYSREQLASFIGNDIPEKHLVKILGSLKPELVITVINVMRMRPISSVWRELLDARNTMSPEVEEELQRAADILSAAEAVEPTTVNLKPLEKNKLLNCKDYSLEKVCKRMHRYELFQLSSQAETFLLTHCVNLQLPLIYEEHRSNMLNRYWLGGSEMAGLSQYCNDKYANENSQ